MSGAPQAGQQFPTEIEQIACARSPVADAVRTESSCPNGTIARVGFGLASSAFLPTIEQICHNETLAQTHWAKSRIVMSVRKRQLESPTAPLYKTGEFYQNLTDVPRAYTRDAQRMRLQDLLNDTTVVDKYIPANGNSLLLSRFFVSVLKASRLRVHIVTKDLLKSLGVDDTTFKF